VLRQLFAEDAGEMSLELKRGEDTGDDRPLGQLSAPGDAVEGSLLEPFGISTCNDLLAFHWGQVAL